jgi:Spy/CpxP family protein refolding chaperone
MKKITTWFAAGSLVLALAASPVLKADEDKGEGQEKGGGMHEGMGAKMKEKLDLSDAQADKFKETMKAHWEALKPINEEAKGDIDKLRDEVKSKASDSEIKATLAALETSDESRRAEEMKYRNELKGILNPTQQAKVTLWFVHQMMGHMGGHGDWKEKGEKGDWKDKDGDKKDGGDDEKD